MHVRRAFAAGVCACAAGCATASGPVRFAAPGTWEFQATGPTPADHVLRVTLTRPRAARQTATLAGIVGGGNLFRARATGDGAAGDMAVATLRAGEHLPLRFAWDVEAQTPDGRHLQALVTVAIPRLQVGTDPMDPMSPGWEDFIDQAAAGEVHLADRTVILEGVPPNREDALDDDPGGAPLPPASLNPELAPPIR